MENKPLPADPQGQDVSPGEGGQDVFTLKELGESAGREFTNKEDFVKHYKNQSSFVGDSAVQKLREKAQQFDALEAKKSEKTRAKEGQSELYDRMDKNEFLLKNPDAKNVVDDIHAISKARGISMDEAYQNSALKGVVETQMKEQEAANPQFVESGRLPEKKSDVEMKDFKGLPLAEQEKIAQSLPSFDKSFVSDPELLEKMRR